MVPIKSSHAMRFLMILKSINCKIFKVQKFIAAACAIGLFIQVNPSCSYANGISDYEGIQCVAQANDLGFDAVACIDADLPDCEAPDWFPTYAVGSSLGGSDAMNSFTLSSTLRYNEADYSVGSYQRWEHDWYSKANVPYGPALSAYGHIWNEYNGSTLVKSVSCDERGTVSYP